MRAVWRATASCQQRLAWAAAAFVVLCVSEWRIWTSAQSVAASADSMGSDLVLGLLGLVLVQLLALGVFGYATRRWSLAAPGRLDWQNGEGWLVLGIVAVGCVLRLAALQEVPAGLWFDTAESGIRPFAS